MLSLENSFLTEEVKQIIYENKQVEELYDYYCDLINKVPVNRGNDRMNQILVDSMFSITLEYGKTPDVFDNIKKSFVRIDEIDLINESGERAAGFYASKDDVYTTAKVTLNTARVEYPNDEFRILIHEMVHAASLKEQTYQSGYVSRITGLNYDKSLIHLNEVLTENFATNVASKYFGINNYRNFTFGKDNDIILMGTSAWGYPGIETYNDFIKDVLKLHNFDAEEMYFRVDQNLQDLGILEKFKDISTTLGNINDACVDQPNKNVTVYYDKLNTQIIELLVSEIDNGILQNIPTYIGITRDLSNQFANIQRVDKDLLMQNNESIMDNNLKLLDAYLFFQKIAPSMGKSFSREELSSLYAFVGSFEYEDIKLRDGLNFPKPKAETEYQIYSFLEEIKDLRMEDNLDMNKINHLINNIPDIKGFSNTQYDCSEFSDKSALLVFKESESLRDDMIKASMQINGYDNDSNDFTHSFVAAMLYKQGYLDSLMDDCLDKMGQPLEVSTAVKDAYYDYLNQNIDMNRYNCELLFNNQDIHEQNALGNMFSYSVILQNVNDIIDDFQQEVGITSTPEPNLVDETVNNLMKDLLVAEKDFKGIKRTPFERAVDIHDDSLAASYKGIGVALNINLMYRVNDINDYLDDIHRILKDSDYSFSQDVFLDKRNLSKLEFFIKEEDRTKVFSDKLEGLMDKGFLETIRLNPEINENISKSLIERIENNEFYLGVIDYRKNIEVTESFIDTFCELSDDLQKQYSKALLDSQIYTIGEIEQKFIDKGLKLSNVSYDMETEFLSKSSPWNIKQASDCLDTCVFNLELIMVSDKKHNLNEEKIKEYTKLLLDADSKVFINYALNEENLDSNIKESIKEYCKDNPDSLVTKFEDFILEKDDNNKDTKIEIDF